MATKQKLSIENKKIEEVNYFIEKAIYDLRENFDVHPSEVVISMPKYFQSILIKYNEQMLTNFSAPSPHENKFMGTRVIENYLNEIAVYDVNCMFDNNETLKTFKL